MRHVPLVLALILGPLALACGSSGDEGAGGAGGGAPTLEFEGLNQALSSQQGDTAVITLTWFPAKSDGEVTYLLRTWQADPRRPDAGPPEEEDVTPTEPCARSGCRWLISGSAPDAVRWYSVEARIEPDDEEAEAIVAGGEVVLPAAIWASAPEIVSFDPTTAAPGDEVVVVGEHLLTERMWDDALKIGETVVPPENIRGWNNVGLRFVVPEGVATGRISIRAAAPEPAVSTTDLVVP
ncbi:MAG TPA: hypothetical protein VN033_05935 [Vulgatibacter sp.]|nr:hypothetical protein [Vulgatibacter sp.]